MKRILYFIVCTLIISCTSEQTTNIENTANFTFDKLNTISIPFIANEGQIAEDVSYYANIFDGYVFVTREGEIVYNFPIQNDIHSSVNFSESFVDCRKTKIDGEDKSITKINYIKGNDPDKWESNISTYETVNMGEIYDGINLQLKAYSKNVEKIFTIEPCIEPGKIRIGLNGVEVVNITKKGKLELISKEGIITLTKPIAYQIINGQRREVQVSYIILDTDATNVSIYGFEVGKYNQNYELVIDPMIASTLFGSIGNDGWNSYAHLDYEGNIVVYSRTYAANLPTTPGAFDETFNYGLCDVYVSKFNPDLTELLASTFIGGSDSEFEGEFDIGSNGNIYITGRTKSIDYPITQNAYDQVFNEGGTNDIFDVYVSCLSSDLTTLLFSTYLGMSNSDRGDCLILDSNDNVYVTGHTRNDDFPTTPGAYDQTYNTVINAGDAFISKFDPTLSNLLVSTFLGGGRYDGGYSFAFDENDDLYIAGRTDSGSFPTTPNVFQPEKAFAYDFFISKMDNELTTLYASTFLGGGVASEDIPKIKVGNDNCVYLTGTTGSNEYPVTPGAYITDTEDAAGSNDGVVSKLNADLSELLASSYIGYWYHDYCYAIHVDDDLNVYIGGATDCADFLAHPNGWLTSLDGRDAFVIKLNSELSERIAGTFYGGSQDNYVTHIIEDMYGNIITTGIAIAPDFPTTLGAYDETHNGSYDQFITIFDPWLSAETDVDEIEIPTSNVTLYNNYPNPFNPETTVSFSIPNDTEIELTVYNVKGQKIKSLLNDQISAGEHSIVWNGEDDSGKKVGSGVYLYKLTVNDETELVKKCMLLK